jgi:DNA helicase IV
MERVGRIEQLTSQYREAVLKGLAGWDRKMDWVGVVDELGIVAALYRHLPSLQAEFRCVLVDEVQDLGTLELAIIRKITREGENDLFLCGDTAQTIHTKHADLKAAGIAFGGRSHRLNQNYRNSRQILEAAYGVLTRSFELIPKGAADIDVLAPEYANFSSSRPMLMREESLTSELA